MVGPLVDGNAGVARVLAFGSVVVPSVEGLKGGAEVVDENGFRVPDGEFGARHWLQLKSAAGLLEAVRGVAAASPQKKSPSFLVPIDL